MEERRITTEDFADEIADAIRCAVEVFNERGFTAKNGSYTPIRVAVHPRFSYLDGSNDETCCQEVVMCGGKHARSIVTVDVLVSLRSEQSRANIAQRLCTKTISAIFRRLENLLVVTKFPKTVVIGTSYHATLELKDEITGKMFETQISFVYNSR